MGSTQPTPFPDWWKQVGGTTTITLLDVTKIALRRGQFAFDSLNAPFAFTGAAKYVVDASNSSLVRHTDSSTIVTLALNPPSEVLVAVAGLAPLPIESMRAVLSSKTDTVTLEVVMKGELSPSCTFTLVPGRSPMDIYLEGVGYKFPPNVHALSISAFSSSIVGPDAMRSFLSIIPSCLCGSISLPSWDMDLVQSTITTVPSVFGPLVQRAEIIGVTPTINTFAIELPGFNLAPMQVALILNRKKRELYDISLKLEANLGNLHVMGRLSQLSQGPFALDCTVSTPTSLTTLFQLLGLSQPAEAVTLPLEGSSPIGSNDKLEVGFRLSQHFGSVNAPFSLDEISVHVIIQELQPWMKFLPATLQPKDKNDVGEIIVKLLKPNAKQLQVGFVVAYSTLINEKSARLHFRFSHMPLLAANPPATDLTYRTSVSMYVDENSVLTAPDLDSVLQRFADCSWQTITDVMPVLKEITIAVTVTNAFFEIGDKNGSLSITSFALNANIHNLTVLSSPSLFIEEATLALVYNGSAWEGSFDTEMLFANQFHVETRLLLPTKSTPGVFQFNNKDESFTFKELVRAIDSSLDPTAVPVIGSDLASVTLEHFSIHVQYNEQHPITITAFDVEVSWGAQPLGQIHTSNNRLVISWQKADAALPSDPKGGNNPTVNPATSSSNWFILWEGQLSSNFFISAGLSLNTLKQQAGTPPERHIVGSGRILNIDGRTDVGALVNTLTIDALSAPRTSTLWQDTLPADTKSTFSLEQCNFAINLTDPRVYSIAAQATWGSSKGAAALILQRPAAKDAPWSFVLALGVTSFQFGDLLHDSGFANALGSHLTIENAQILAFRNPLPVKLSAVRQQVTDLAPWSALQAPANSEKLDENLQVGTGMAVIALLRISKASSKSESLVNKLATISNSKYPDTDIELFCFINKAADSPDPAAHPPDHNSDVGPVQPTESKTSLELTASISSFPILDSITLKAVRFSFSATRVTSADKRNIVYSKALTLKGACFVQFPETGPPWSFTASLSVDDSKPQLSVKPIVSEKLQHLGKITFTDIRLNIEYTFSSPASSTQAVGPAVPNLGEVKHGTTTAKYEIGLHATVNLGTVRALASVIFLSGTPQVVAVDVPGKINIGELFQEILGDGFPRDILDISFSDLHLWYSWSSATIPVPGALVTKHDKASQVYKPGFHADAKANVFGLEFLISLDVTTGDAAKKGLKLQGLLEKSVDLAILVLHDKHDKEKGPSFGYSTYKKADNTLEGSYIEAGITIFGTKIGYGSFQYQKAHENIKDRFIVDFTVEADIIPGSPKIPFELTETDGKTHVRFIGLPIKDIKDPFSGSELLSMISKLTKMDKCGAIDLILKEAIKTTFKVSVSLSRDQPKKVEGQPLLFAFDLNGYWNIECAGLSVDKVDFKTLTLEAEVAKDWGSLFNSIVKFLGSSVEHIVKALKDNADNFSEVLIILGVEKLGTEALKAWACRNQRQQKPGEGEAETEEQPEEQPEDSGGQEGDGGSGSGGSGVFTEALGAISGAAAAAGEGAFVVGVSLVAIGAGAFVAWLFSGDSHESQVPKPHEAETPPGPLPSPTRPFDRAVYAALDKKFDRWLQCTSYTEALETAHACALDYRGAIDMLRWTLKNARSSLTEVILKDYSARLHILIYQFSELSSQFGKKWLSSEWRPLLEVHSTHFTVTLTDDFRDRWLAITIRGVQVIVTPTKSNTVTIPWTTVLPPSTINEKITAEFVAFAVHDGGDPKYRFFSRGAPFLSAPAWYIHRSELFGDPAATTPSFDDFNDLQCYSEQTRLKPDHSIRSITIQHGWIVDGITVQYKLTDGSLHSVDHGTTYPINTSFVSLKDTEILYAITGKAGTHSYYNCPYIHQISFRIYDHSTSQLRVEGPFGNGDGRNEGQPFSFEGPVSGFAGRAADTGSTLRGLNALAFIRTRDMNNEMPPTPMCLVRSPTLLGDPEARAPDFDDLMNSAIGGSPGKLKIDPERAIESVMITHGWIIDGIQLTYRLLDGTRQTVDHGTTNYFNTSVVKLNADEIIQSISGKAGMHSYFQWPYIHQISFQIMDRTSGRSRNEGPFGNGDRKNEGEHFEFRGPVTAFAGRAVTSTTDRGLNALSFVRVQSAMKY